MPSWRPVSPSRRLGIVDGPALAACDELTAAHEDLRRLFVGGDSAIVPGLALSVLVLAERVAILLG